MTRWARANNAHKRQASEASSWNDLSEKNSSGNDWRNVRRQQSKDKRKQKRRMKVCFNCRSTDHTVANCPNLPTQNIAAGICFKCGSTEHKSNTCKAPKKGSVEFPFASCFVCGEKGHLSSKCPKNSSGIYPKGGSCHTCGSVWHLKKDCPDLSKEKPEKNNETTVQRQTNNESVEKVESEDEYEEEQSPKPKKKTKLVKFQ